MIVASKVLKSYSNIVTMCLSAGILALVILHVIIKPFNYRRIDLYLITIGLIYVITITCCAIGISKTSIITII